MATVEERAVSAQEEIARQLRVQNLLALRELSRASSVVGAQIDSDRLIQEIKRELGV